MSESIFPKVSKGYFVLGDRLFEDSISEASAPLCFEGESGTLEIRITLNGDWLTLGAAVECESAGGLSDIGGVLSDDTLSYSVPAALMHGEYIRFHLRGTDGVNIRKTADAVIRIIPSFDASGTLPELSSSAYDGLSSSISQLNAALTQCSQNISELSSDMTETVSEFNQKLSDRDIIISKVIGKAGITSLESMFTQSGMVNLPSLDFSEITSMAYCFKGCASLVTVPDLNLPICTTLYECFYGCSNLKSVGKLTTPLVQKMYSLFRNCLALETIEEIDMSSVNSCNLIFANCTSLKNITFAGTIPISLDMRSCPLTIQSLDSLVSALCEDGSGKTVIFNQKTYALLTEEQLASMSDKGWTAEKV